MRVTLNRFTVRLLLLALLPIVLLIRLWKRLTSRERPRKYNNTIDADPLAYNGSRPLVVSIWANYATVWKVVTEKMIAQLCSEYADRCEFIYIDGSQKGSVDPRLKVNVLPAVLVFHSGHEVGRFVNMVKPDEVRKLLDDLAKE